MSGNAFSFLYKNKQKKNSQYLLDQIYKNCKIFFNMSSTDKSLVIKYYKEKENNFICSIGQCQVDIDSIISSDVGINLQNPKNQNTILCHFYSLNSDISCIKYIIMEGRVLYENTILLELVSFLCTLVLDSFILCCLIRNTDVVKGQLNFLEIEFLILSILSFLGRPKENKISNSLSQKKN